jgi:hypothetical protein
VRGQGGNRAIAYFTAIAHVTATCRSTLAVLCPHFFLIINRVLSTLKPVAPLDTHDAVFPERPSGVPRQTGDLSSSSAGPGSDQQGVWLARPPPAVPLRRPLPPLLTSAACLLVCVYSPCVSQEICNTDPPRGFAANLQAQGSAQQKELQLIGLEPQRFAVAKGQLTTIASAAFPFLMRLGSGGFVSGYSVSLVKDDGKYAMLEGLGRKMREESAALSGFNRPQQPITLYEFEGCPFCRKVREAVNILDLDVLFKPCPKDGPNWRPEANQKGGKRMVSCCLSRQPTPSLHLNPLAEARPAAEVQPAVSPP